MLKTLKTLFKQDNEKLEAHGNAVRVRNLEFKI